MGVELSARYYSRKDRRIGTTARAGAYSRQIIPGISDQLKTSWPGCSIALKAAVLFEGGHLEDVIIVCACGEGPSVSATATACSASLRDFNLDTRQFMVFTYLQHIPHFPFAHSIRDLLRV